MISDGARADGGNFEALLSRIQSPALLAVAQQWHEARGQHRMPSWADIPPTVLSTHSKLIWGYDRDPKTGDFSVRIAGDRLRKWISPNPVGVRYQDAAPPSSFEEAHRYLTKIVTASLALRTSGRLFLVGDFAVSGERIILPMAADAKTGDSVLGASDYAVPPLLGPVELVHENVEWYAI
ncbi:MAG TPA: PAS domain-containing protein [Rhizomicrobium sp.]|nr:PAS domain-containing protein [Rhizomicrobium sp.]